MYSETESWFRNLIAYEQCRNDLSVHWCSYMRLMSCLIGTPEDVKLLVEKKVLLNFMGSNEAAAEVWKKLGVNEKLFLTEGDKKIMDSINKHCGSDWKTWPAVVQYLYFSRRWSFLLAVAAYLLLVMVFLQTFFIIAEYAPK